MKPDKHKTATAALDRVAALNCIPVKSPHVVEARQAEGRVLLTYPAPIIPRLGALMRWLGRDLSRGIHRKLELDALGSAVWCLLDGRRTVDQVVSIFAKQYQLHPQEAEISVTQFLKILGKRGLIHIKQVR